MKKVKDAERQALLSILDANGPLTSKELWAKYQALGDATPSKASKAKMKRTLKVLKSKSLVKARPHEGSSYRYHVIWNKYEQRYKPNPGDLANDAPPTDAEAAPDPSTPPISA